MDEEDTITAWRDGKFVTISEPDWWMAEMERLWPQSSETRAPRWLFVTGSEFGPRIEVYRLEPTGFLVSFDHSEEIVSLVHVASKADLLEMMTTRGASWSALAAAPSVHESMAEIRNAAIGYFRHGPGKHIEPLTGKSDKDE
jgi:hypothetical protein